MFAAMGGYREIVKILIDHRANLETRNYTGLTALMMAVIEGHRDVAQLLLDSGAEMEACDQQGYTALTFAMAQRIDLVSFLEERGANRKYAKEILDVQFFSHVWGLKGRYKLKNETGGYETIFSLEGLPPYYSMFMVSKYVKKFFKSSHFINELIDPEHQGIICKALGEAYPLKTQSCQEIRTKLSLCQPIIFLGGGDEHAVSIIMHKKHLIICNKGKGSKPNSIEMYALPQQKVTAEFIHSLQWTYPDIECFNKMIADLKLEPLEGFFQKKQKVGNCTWKNGEGAFRVLLKLYVQNEADWKLLCKVFTYFVGESELKKYTYGYNQEVLKRLQWKREKENKACDNEVRFARLLNDLLE